MARVETVRETRLTTATASGVACDGFRSVSQLLIPTCVLTGKSEMRGGGQRTQPLGIRLKLLEPITDLLDHLIKRVQSQMWQRLFAPFLAVDVPLGSVLDCHTAVPLRSSSAACREHGRALAQESRAR